MSIILTMMKECYISTTLVVYFTTFASIFINNDQYGVFYRQFVSNSVSTSDSNTSSIVRSRCCNKFGVSMVAAESLSSSLSSIQQQRRKVPYNPYQYDLTIPQFTPDGRLLQVEYAQKAAIDHSIPIIVASIYAKRNKGNKMNDRTTGSEQIIIFIACHHSKMSQQSRFIVLPTRITSLPSSDMYNSNQHHHHNNDKIVIAISGILSDALAILQIIQAFRIQEYRTMGDITFTSATTTNTRRIAHHIASQCQSRTISGGKRPYGATIWIMPTSTCTTTYNPHPLLLHQIDPSGAVHDLILSSSSITKHRSNNNSNIIINDDDVVVVLGGGTIGTAMQNRLQSEWYGMMETNKNITESQTTMNNDEMNYTNPIPTLSTTANMYIQQRIGELLYIAMDEYRTRYNVNTSPEHSNGNIKNQQHDDPTTDNKIMKDHGINHHNDDDIVEHLEVVLVSSKRGTIQLSTNQIRSFLQKRTTNTPSLNLL